ncbi:MAG: TIGR03086 family protein [Nocardioidaceae bacterium]|nr:TIGR03086 family protein [Nocardioidaceae bacterium]
MTYTKTVTLPVPPDEAFALITEPERLRRWQVVSAYVDLRAGGGYRWTVVPGAVAAGTFREVEPGRRLVLGWGWEGNDDLKPDASTVTVTIEPEADGSRVTLVHEGLGPEQEAMHAEGWDHYLGRLQTLAGAGDAGQDEWAWAPQDLTPVSAADAVLAVVQPVLRRLTDEDREKPTPCADFTCHDLAEHLVASLRLLGSAAGVSVVEPAPRGLEDLVSTIAAQVIDGWRAVDLDGTVPGPDGSPLPAAFLASVLPVEILLHGWDLAQASGQTLRVSDEVVDYVRGLAETVVPAARPNGSFGDEVTPAADADAVDRLAAYAGRRPLSA